MEPPNNVQKDNECLIGYSNCNGHPSVNLTVHGFHRDLNEQFEAQIDTGFSGFLMMPMRAAFRLGLILFGTKAFRIADGSTNVSLLAHGTVIVGNLGTTGIIVLSTTNDHLLLGMEYLTSSGRALVVSGQRVALVDDKCARNIIHPIQIFS